MRNLIIIFVLVLGMTTLLCCQTQQKADYFIHKNLTRLWETPQDLTTSESVCYDPIQNVLYVACINGNPTDKDDNGFIARVAVDGKILKQKWVEGLNAPKGMGIFDGKLFVTDIDQVVEINMENGAIVKRYAAEGAKFLNDIAVDKAGNVYISDMVTNKIHRLSQGNLENWLDSPMLNTPNGLFVEDGHLLIGISGSVLKVELESKKISTYIENTGGIDGLEAAGNGNYIISDWQGNVNLIHPGKEKIKLLDTTPVKMNAADIEFIMDKKILLVPTFFDNRVVAYQLKEFK